MQKGFAPILILVGVLVLIAGGVYYLGIKKAPVQQVQNPMVTFQTAQATPTPSTSDQTVNWKTYTNNENNYSFKYPQTWQLEQEGTTIRIFDPKSKYSESFSFITYSPVSPKKLSLLSIEDFVKQQQDNIPYLQFTPITIGGIEGKRTTDIPGADVYDTVFVKRGSTIYKIELSNEGASITKDTFDQILSTFKFTQ